MASIINASSSGSGGIVQTADASGVLQLQSNGTVALTINSGGSNLSIGPYTNSTSGTFNGTLQIGSNTQIMSFANGTTNTQTQLGSNTYYSGGYKAIAGGAGASKLFIGGGGTFEFSGAGTLTNAGDAITFTPTLSCGALAQTIALQGATSVTGTGISFPGTQFASSDANTLDDYEEGTWTPSITFGGGSTGITYGTRIGRYTKIGNCVTFNFYVAMTNKGSSTGVMQVNGLPFTSQSVGGGYNTQTMWTNNTTSSLTGIVEGYVNAGTTNVYYEYQSSGFYGALTSFTNTQCSNSSDFMCGGVYYI